MKNLHIDLGFDQVSFSHSIDHLVNANMNIIYLNCRKRYKVIVDWHSYVHNLSNFTAA